jgi:hypothetical protein
MNNWFLCTVKYTKQTSEGTFKRVSEKYLLAAMTFTDAEARIYEELGTIIRGEFIVQAIAREDLHDIFYYEDADIWYKCKIVYESMDADSEKSKKITQFFYVSASSVKEAAERLKDELQTLMVDYKVISVVESPVVDIFPFVENLDKEISRTSLQEGSSSEKQDARFEQRVKVLEEKGFVKDQSDDETWWSLPAPDTDITFIEIYSLSDEEFNDKVGSLLALES